VRLPELVDVQTYSRKKHGNKRIAWENKNVEEKDYCGYLRPPRRCIDNKVGFVEIIYKENSWLYIFKLFISVNDSMQSK